MFTAVPQEHFLCLDMLRVNWVSNGDSASAECAILMEIWDSGGILQTEKAIPMDSIVTLAAPKGPVRAKVTTCTQDSYGFLIHVTVDPSEGWFPDSYCPDHLISSVPD